MLQLFSQCDPDDHASLRDALAAHLRAVAELPRGDRTIVRSAEAEVRADPAAHIRFAADGSATLHAVGRTFHAGRFATPRLGDLRRRVEEMRPHGDTPGALRFWVLDGASPATDIGALQGTAPGGSLFQVASQFNCLESPGAYLVDVADYFRDATQGPRASISAFPGTLVRHYAAPAPDGSRFVQRPGHQQVNLLDAVCAPEVASAEGGYLTISKIIRPDVFARSLTDRFEDLRVGLHDDVEVAFGCNWDGPVVGAPHHRIAQAFTSSVAAGMYGRLDGTEPAMATIVTQLQRAAYLGTLLGAAALGKSHVALTLIGGGVFGNPASIIWESVLWAVDMVRPLLPRDLVIVVNGRNLGRHIPAVVLREQTATRGGTLVTFGHGSVAVG
jgi:hypothetical protein